MTNKEKQILKEKRKNKFFKVLHIICYILSSLFIILCVVAGVKSCKKDRQSVYADDSNPFSNLVTIDGSVGLGWNNVQLINSYFGISNDVTDNVYYSYRGLVINSYCIVDNNYVYIDSLDFEFASLEQGNGDNYWQLVQIYLMTNGLYYAQLFNFNNYDLEYHYFNNIKSATLMSPSNISDYSYPLSLFFNFAESKTFTFNKQINYNAPLNGTINSVYSYTGSFTDYLPDGGAYIDYNLGRFVSNNEVFETIRVYYFDTGSVFGLVDNEIKQLPSNAYVYAMMEYRRSDGSGHIVNIHDQLPFKNNGGDAFYYGNSSTWKIDTYRNIVIYGNPLNSTLDGLLSFNNNSQTLYNGNIYYDGNDVFSLLSYCFAQLSGFWSLMILPGISIGVLYFLPAVVGVVIIIVHILRK